MDRAEAEDLALAAETVIMEEPLATWVFLPPSKLQLVCSGDHATAVEPSVVIMQLPLYAERECRASLQMCAWQRDA